MGEEIPVGENDQVFRVDRQLQMNTIYVFSVLLKLTQMTDTFIKVIGIYFLILCERK